MKTILLTLMLIILCSCGGASKGGSSNSNQSSSELSEEIAKEIDCLEDKLGWLVTPPSNQYEAIRMLGKVDIETCSASNEAIEIYTQRVLDNNPNFNQ